MRQERIETTIVNGERENLECITTRLPFSVAAQLDGLARAKRQSRSLYLSELLRKHVERKDESEI